MDLALYAVIREHMCNDPNWASQIDWAECVKRPATPDDMARELIFVIANSGMKNTVARRIFRRVMAALDAGESASTAFGHTGKAGAMDRLWNDRVQLYEEMSALTDDALPEWCGKLPFIGKITKWHAAKNLGADVAKPDRWLERVAQLSHESTPGLCARLAKESGDRIATVDLVIWWAMASGVLVIAGHELRLVAPTSA